MKLATDLSFCPQLDNMLSKSPMVGRSGRVLASYPTSGFDDLVVLRNICMTRQPRITLEVGLACGGSALAIAASHRDLGHVATGQHIAIDPHQLSPDVYDGYALLTLKQAGLGAYVRFYPTYSSQTLPELVKDGLQIDLAYIDGSHLFEDVFVDFYYTYRLLGRDGILCFDDCNFRDVRKVIRFIERNFEEMLIPFNLAPYRPDRGKTWKYAVKRRLNRLGMMAFRKVGPRCRAFGAPFTNF